VRKKTGDGTMLFGQIDSLWCFSRYHFPVIIVVYNNRSYAGPRSRFFNLSSRPMGDRKDIACYLGDPEVDFVGIAASFGIKGEIRLSTKPNRICYAAGSPGNQIREAISD